MRKVRQLPDWSDFSTSTAFDPTITFFTNFGSVNSTLLTGRETESGSFFFFFLFFFSLFGVVTSL